MKHPIKLALVGLFLTLGTLQASEYIFAVIMPESIDGSWYWYNTPESQHLVQARIEKELIGAGHKVVDVSDKKLSHHLFSNGAVAENEQLVERARALGVTHIITGRAVATGTDASTAYGLKVYRSQADISLRIIDAGNAQILAVETAEALDGGQGYVAAGKKALKSAAKDIASKLLKQLRNMSQNDKDLEP